MGGFGWPGAGGFSRRVRVVPEQPAGLGDTLDELVLDEFAGDVAAGRAIEFGAVRRQRLVITVAGAMPFGETALAVRPVLYGLPA